MENESNLISEIIEVGENHFIKNFYYIDAPRNIKNFYHRIFSKTSFSGRVEEIRDVCVKNNKIKPKYGQRFLHEIGQLIIDYDMPPSSVGTVRAHILNEEILYPVDILIEKDWDQDERHITKLYLSDQTTQRDVKLIWKYVKEVQLSGPRRNFYNPELYQDIYDMHKGGKSARQISNKYSHYSPADIRQIIYNYRKAIES